MERKEGILNLISGSFRENTDGDAVLDMVDAGKDGFHTFLDVISVEEQTVKASHPDGEKRHFFHFLFGDITGWSWNSDICKDDVKETAMVGYIQDRLILWHVLFTDNSNLGATEKDNTAEGPIYNCKAATVFDLYIKFTNNPLNEH
jgi:hypothetical protein